MQNANATPKMQLPKMPLRQMLQMPLPMKKDAKEYISVLNLR